MMLRCAPGTSSSWTLCGVACFPAALIVAADVLFTYRYVEFRFVLSLQPGLPMGDAFDSSD
jgi:hypothetical protein